MDRKKKKQFRGRAGVEAFQKRMDKRTRNALGLPQAGNIPSDLRESYQREYRHQVEQAREEKLARKKPK